MAMGIGPGTIQPSGRIYLGGRWTPSGHPEAVRAAYSMSLRHLFHGHTHDGGLP